MSKLPFRDGDGLWQQAGVAVYLALLAEQAGSCPVGNVIGEPTQGKSGRHMQEAERQASKGGKCCARAKKCFFLNFAGMMGQKTPGETSPTKR
jgi:hypothetical protein